MLLLAGCATDRPRVDRALLANTPPTARHDHPAEAYTLACPDVVDVVVDKHPDLSGRREIGPDGRIDLVSAGRMRVEGQTVTEVSHSLADALGVVPAGVHVQVAEYASQQIYLIGEVEGLQRAVPYRGPETVLELLRRVGGITPGAAPDEVYVVRSHVADGQAPEVFRVDLKAILFRRDARTNVYLQPLDQVFVGETRKCSLIKCLPPWLRPLYETVFGMRRPPIGEDRETGRVGDKEMKRET